MITYGCYRVYVLYEIQVHMKGLLAKNSFNQFIGRLEKIYKY